jgi:hypothetical protein
MMHARVGDINDCGVIYLESAAQDGIKARKLKISMKEGLKNPFNEYP